MRTNIDHVPWALSIFFERKKITKKALKNKSCFQYFFFFKGVGSFTKRKKRPLTNHDVIVPPSKGGNEVGKWKYPRKKIGNFEKKFLHVSTCFHKLQRQTFNHLKFCLISFGISSKMYAILNVFFEDFFGQNFELIFFLLVIFGKIEIILKIFLVQTLKIEYFVIFGEHYKHFFEIFQYFWFLMLSNLFCNFEKSKTFLKKCKKIKKKS